MGQSVSGENLSASTSIIKSVVCKHFAEEVNFTIPSKGSFSWFGMMTITYEHLSKHHSNLFMQILCFIPQVTWRRANPSLILTVGLFTYFGDARFQTHNVLHKDQWNLHIRNVSLQDQGRYECQVSTKGRDIRRSYQLHVRGGC